MKELYKLKEMLCEELEEYGRKNEVSAASLEVIDKLAHAIKNICKIIEKYEEDEEGYSSADGSSYGSDDGGMSGASYVRGGSNGARGYNSARGGRGRSSYARGGSGGRSSNRVRYTGGYSENDGYSMANEDMSEMIDEMRGLMNSLPEEKKMEVKRFISKMESM